MKVLGWAFILLGMLVMLIGFGVAISDIQLILGFQGVQLIGLGIVIKK